MHPVLAYLDLASGSMIVQAAIAGIVVVPVLLRHKIWGPARESPGGRTRVDVGCLRRGGPGSIGRP